MASGRPFTPSTSNAQEDLGEGSRPDRIALGTLPNPGPERWFDTSAFPLVPLNSYRFGNSGRNILDGAGMVVFNLSFMKNFRLRETGTLQFRLEGFNATNHTNFRLPDRNVNTVTGATIDAAGPSPGLSGRAALRILMRPMEQIEMKLLCLSLALAGALHAQAMRGLYTGLNVSESKSEDGPRRRP